MAAAATTNGSKGAGEGSNVGGGGSSGGGGRPLRIAAAPTNATALFQFSSIFLRPHPLGGRRALPPGLHRVSVGENSRWGLLIKELLEEGIRWTLIDALPVL